MKEPSERKPDTRKQLGAQGEALASAYLENRGLRILARNWRCRSGEVDLIAEEGDTLIFIEVRTRRLTGRFGLPEESVDSRKQRQVREVAQYYRMMTNSHNRKCRFDVVAVKLLSQDPSLNPDIRHIPNAF